MTGGRVAVLDCPDAGCATSTTRMPERSRRKSVRHCELGCEMDCDQPRTNHVANVCQAPVAAIASRAGIERNTATLPHRLTR